MTSRLAQQLLTRLKGALDRAMLEWSRSPRLLKLFVGQHIINGLSVAAGVMTVAIAASALFGFGFSGLVPANVLASRELFPVGEAYWRIPTLLLCSGTGMATGAWIGGILYDHFGYYAPAFATGVAVSAVNFMIISALAFRRSQTAPA